MAVIQENKSVQPTTITKFLGLNLSDTGDTQIELGESGNMTNFYITDDYKLRKAQGYKNIYDFGSPIKGMHSTKIGNTEYLLIAAGGKLYRYLKSALEDEYLSTPEKTKRFTGDGETTTFSLGLTNIESVESLYVNGVLIEETDYTMDFVNGTFTLPEAPENDTPITINFTKHLIPYEIGSINNTDASFFEFGNQVYILAGGYYVWDGVTVQEVEGYVPTVFINTPAGVNGGGTIYEEINMLSPKKKQTFNGDGGDASPTRTFKIAQAVELISRDPNQPNKSYIDKVIVDGTTLTANTQYSFYVDSNSVTHYDTIKLDNSVTYKTGQDNVEISWSKDDGDRAIIEGMKFGTVFGGDVDTRVFLYGHPTYRNRVYYSAIAYENDIAVPSVEYFPATAQVDIGPSNFAVTDLTRQYDRLLATTNKPEAYYLTISTEQLQVTLAGGETATRYVPSVKTLPLNEAHGNVAMGQGQVLMNYPVTFEDSAIVMWKATNVRDEKNAEIISTKIKKDLDNIAISGIKTLDLQEHNQLWVLFDNKVWIYNYINKTYSRLQFPTSMNNMSSLNGRVYMSTLQGSLVKFSENYNTYGEEPIPAYWEMNFADFGVPYLRKTMTRLWISMQPSNWASADVSYISNLSESQITKHIEYKKQWFDKVNFADWHFTASINPQPFRLKLKAKKFTNLKLIIKNNEASTCTILSIVLQVDSFGYSK